METITELDVVNHFKQKVTAASDDLCDVKNQMKNIDDILDSVWKGPSSNQFREKLEDIYQSVLFAENNIDESIRQLRDMEKKLIDKLEKEKEEAKEDGIVLEEEILEQ